MGRGRVITTESHITQEARAYIGRKSEIHKVEVSAKDIRRFAVTIGDKNPLWRDEAAAAKGPNGGIVAPPFFFTTLALEEEELDDLEASGLGKKMGLRMEVPVPGFPGAVAGGRKIIFGVPIRAGDVISVQEEVVEIYEKQGRRGPMVFVASEWTYTNQRGERAVTETATVIRIK